MKTSAFLFSLLCFLVYLWNECKRGRRRKIKPLQAGAAAERKEAPRNDFYINRLETLYSMLKDATEEEEKQRARVNKILELNQYGIVINEKNEKRARGELYRVQQKKLSIENQIYHTKQAIVNGG